MALKSFNNIEDFCATCAEAIEKSVNSCVRFEVGKSWAQYRLFVNDGDFVSVRWVKNLELDNPVLSITMSSYSPTEKQIQLYQHMTRLLSA